MRLAAAAEASGEPVAGTEAVRRQLEDGAPGDSSELSAWADAGAVWAQAIAAHETLLVLLDDVDRLDARSLTLVRRVAATAAGRSIRWLWAGAPGLVAEGSPESLLVQAGWAERMSLGPLEPSESMALIGARLRTTPPMVLADFLRERCGGHAGFTVEVLRRAADVGAIREGASGLVVDRALLDGMPLPADFTAACLQRLDELSADATRAARALAVWDAPLSASALPRFGVSDAELAIEALHAAGLLVRNDHGDVVLQPPAVARALLAGLADSEREAIGRRALAEPGLSHEQRFRLWRSMGDPVPALAEAEQAFRLRPEITLAVQAAGLADSFGDVALGGAWNGRAGRQLFAHGRHREAIPYLEKAIKVTAPSPERELWICELLGNYLRTGAHETWKAQIERFSAEPVGPVCRVGLLLSREAYHYTRGELVECRRLHAEAAQVAEACGDEGARGLVALIRSLYAHRVDHRGGDAIPFAERAIEHYRRAGDVRGRLRAVGALGAALWAAQRVHECGDVLEEALAEARALDLPLVLAELLTSRIVMLVVAGDWRSALARMDEALLICIEAGWPGYASFHMTTLTLFSAMVGDTQKAMRIAPRMLRLARRHAPLGIGGAWRAVGVAARNHGRRRLAERSFALALRAQPLGAAPLEYQWIRLEHGTMKAWHGHWAEALEIWRSALLEHDAPDMLESVLLHLQCARGRLRLEAETTGGELERASVEAWCIESGHPLARAHALHFDAEWHLINGRVEATIAAVRGCFAAYEQFPSPADVAHAALAFARLGHRSPIGPRLPLTEWAEKAAAGFQRLGDRVSRHDAMELAIECYRSRRTTSPKASRDRELLQGVGRLVESISDFEQLSKAAMQLAVDELDAERGLLLIASGRGGDEADLAPVVEHGAVDAETLGKALGYSRKAVRRMRESGEPLLIRDAATELEGHSQSVVDLGLRSILCVPLIAEERLIGAVYLDDRRRSHAFGNMERDQLVSFAELLAVAIQRSRGHDAVQRENAELLGENLVLRREAGRRLRPANFIGSSQAMQRTLAVVERAAKTERTVLITGENGTGKELIARMIHHSGPRADKPFIEVNCGAISGDLMVSELFGIEGRVASGVDRRPGLFRAANGGTLFLDEIGDMSMPGQIALLRALAERTVVPVGGSRPVPVDVRVVAATNQDLAGLIEGGSFRRDLFFRINVLPVEVPPLRERRSDIPALTRHFAAAVAAKEGRDVPTLSRELLDVLMESEWPGNVRELENYIERLMTLQIENVLVPDPLPFDLRQGGAKGAIGRAGQRLPDRSAEFERLAVVEALERHGWHQSRAARDLGLTEQSIRYRIRKFKLLRPR